MEHVLADGTPDPSWPEFWTKLVVGQYLFMGDWLSFARSLMGNDADDVVDGKASGKVKTISYLTDIRSPQLSPLALWIEVECEKHSRFLFIYQADIMRPVEVWVMEKLESEPINRAGLVEAGATMFFEGEVQANTYLPSLKFAQALAMPNPLSGVVEADTTFECLHSRERVFRGLPYGLMGIFRPYSFTGEVKVHGLDVPQQLTIGYLLVESWRGTTLESMSDEGGLIEFWRGVVVTEGHDRYFSTVS